MNDPKDVSEAQITYGNLVKIVAALICVTGYVLASYAWVQSIKSDLELQKQESRLFQDATNKQLNILSDGLAQNQRAVTDLNMTLNRTNTILETLTKKGQ